MTSTKKNRRPMPIVAWRFDKSRRLVVGVLLCVAALLWFGRGEWWESASLWPARQQPPGAVAEGGEEEAVPVLAPASVRIVSATDPMESVQPAAVPEAVDSAETDELAGSPTRGHPFDLLLMDRERARSSEAERWQLVLRDGSRSAAQQDEAARRLDVLWADSRLETEVEHLLSAQGFRAIATADRGRLRVVVDGILDADTASRIGELIVRSTGVGRDAVTIVDSFSSGG